MRRHWMLMLSLLIVTGISVAVAGVPSEGTQYTSDFGIASADTLLATGSNRYMSLNPGSFLQLEGEDDGQSVVIAITVLPKFRQVRFQADGGAMTVKTRVVEEREWTDGVLTQVALNYYARCPSTGNIYCFGEHATQYEEGVVVGHEGSWLAGKHGAKPGLAMPGHFLLGARYHQTLAPGVSMDRAENLAMNDVVETDAGTFASTVTVLETTHLEPDEEVLKTYAAGIGLISDGDLHLVDYHN